MVVAHERDDRASEDRLDAADEGAAHRALIGLARRQHELLAPCGPREKQEGNEKHPPAQPTLFLVPKHVGQIEPRVPQA